MTTNKHLKRIVRSRAARTGEPYATALRKIRQERDPHVCQCSLNRRCTTSCSFCGKQNTEVERLVAGPGVFICNECVELALVVLEDAASATPEESTRWRAAYKHPNRTMHLRHMVSADTLRLGVRYADGRRA